MDQGIAAVLAGVAGLAGAGIGGFSAAWGAKIGAQTTARATQRQVHDQGVVAHEQWLQERRLDAVYEMYLAYALYVDAVTAMKALLEGDARAADRVREQQIGPGVDAVERAHYRIRLLGLEEVRRASGDLRDAVRSHADAVNEWRRQVLVGGPDEPPTDETREQRLARLERIRQWAQRMGEARRTAEGLVPATGRALTALTSSAREALHQGPRLGGDSGA